MGTVARDALAIDLFTDMDLSTDATDTGDEYQVDWPGLVRAELVTGTVAGANTVVLQGCGTEDFTTDDVVTLCQFNVASGDSDLTLSQVVRVDSKFVRAVATIGTGGDMDGSTFTLVPPYTDSIPTLDSSKALA